MPNNALLDAALLAALAAAIGGFWYGHSQYQQGLAVGRAELSAYRGQVAEQRRIDGAAALLRYQEQTRQLADVSGQLDVTLTALDAARDQITRRITRAAQRPAPVAGADNPGLLSVDGLRVYNDALGLRADASAPAAGQPDADNAAAAAADSGVSRADLLAHARDYGAWCQSVAASRGALIQIHAEAAHGQ
ncbi:hypothetical protein ACFFU8_17790 [Chromobacterium piscinae]|uniref:hypothetical protein n=1 Tax=Chromobacterium piscinae TaxID=686831 RepID=UPI001E3D1DCF|nr:hypothetical protein [Chromobacterium piscinae]MCD5329607.1 hypothetical protein [Chromobacterium piscinae]